MNSIRNLLTLFGGIAVALVVGCNSANIAGVSTGGTGITSGPVTGFGSIFVNGIEFGTDDADIYVNGDPADETALAQRCTWCIEW